ncbi:UPF0481 protein At3g47200-like [Magnolia sinica]|uniref:UPF0481 protein At3g47200-like n=1 Tax=Magnolia sinica TaxID=86752 RepID=UPI002659FB6D|nr:UPF0481 protein At3g47200-like [Magnolia sinica]
MMVIDGCFIIALLCKVAGLITGHKDDPIFNMVWLWSKLQNDLLMFENQIPFIILQRLFDLMKVLGGHDCPSLTRLALDFFQGLVPKIETATKENPNIKPKHLLHLFHSSLLPTPKEYKPTKLNQREANDFNLIKSTKALKKAGIKFKKAEAADSFFDVKFKAGTMEIPTIVIGESTNSVFLNLIAFEQCYSACTDHFTDYTAFMNCLINSPIDVGTLCESGIIVNWLGRDHEVANLFKMLAKTLTVSTNKFYLSDVFWEINQHRQTTYGACMESLKRFYFNSFWSIFPFGAAIILLVLTFLQTIFTMHAYYHPPS